MLYGTPVGIFEPIGVFTMPFSTPDLPYDYRALEPWIDEATMRVHHDKHHETYTQKLNAALEGTSFTGQTIESLLRSLATLPESLQTAVKNHGGGHYNHNLFWRTMSPSGGGNPEGRLAKAIDSSFGSLAEFRSQFKTVALNRFGSGWAWLTLGQSGTLEIVSTANQDSPLSAASVPLLGLDVWEHAYYLQYQNRRAEYAENFWHVVDWKSVAAIYESAL